MNLLARSHTLAVDLHTGVQQSTKDRDPAVLCERWRTHRNKLVVGKSLLVVAASNPMTDFEQAVARAAVLHHLDAA